ncbi:DUF3291 domain-containing protein [Marivita sp. S6314]|uniref:DUF3291 domain-containing protein n=1 Tax=Marivita sp. S6314 TaxID=2926406 RepID=UPI001FF4D7D6|nr:DUF3291 domain-containing protein [Marivita sp. S6314]MCK0149445.1 DUF3291 domain-containing protein [Marivita sp. S6314]
MTRHLAEINVARLKYDADDARVAKFIDNIDRINGIADRSVGFQWRNAEETKDPILGDDRLIATVSVWESAQTLERFVFDTLHRQFFQQRQDWFDVMDSMHFAMWWVTPGSQPSLAEAVARLDHLNANGDSDHAFGWRHLPDATRWREMHKVQAAE